MSCLNFHYFCLTILFFYLFSFSIERRSTIISTDGSHLVKKYVAYEFDAIEVRQSRSDLDQCASNVGGDDDHESNCDDLFYLMVNLLLLIIMILNNQF